MSKINVDIMTKKTEFVSENMIFRKRAAEFDNTILFHRSAIKLDSKSLQSSAFLVIPALTFTASPPFGF